ncbi:GNAT family N-acetyltransferase [Isoptericola sp. 4D.3]|uniref:GNAT family N-acetyltransferase n=1 Tax=Isoptericola peretonis TaxID=2918523 RepID=A0ABT0J8S4_9MICO|nr:GNAT family N-acetyltransferase [Isoptericola sp. 4D.3]
MTSPQTTPRTSHAAPAGVLVRPARPEESARVAWLAALTFPLACPAGTPVGTMAAHVAAHLTPAHFESWAASDRHALLVAVEDAPGSSDVPLGYALLGSGEPDGEEEVEVLRSVAGPGPYVELSKIYVHPHALGSGVAARLMAGAVGAADGLGPVGAAPLWLGTNGENARAQAFYRKHGFEVVGSRTYDVGGVQHADVVMLHRP